MHPLDPAGSNMFKPNEFTQTTWVAYVIKYEEIENYEEIKSVVILKERFIRINYAGKG